MILVTGATGLLGSRLLYDLAKEGKSVRALIRPGSSAHLFEQYTADEPSVAGKIEWVEGDLLDIESLEAALDGVEIVYNCAGLVSFQPSESKLLDLINIGGVANLVNSALLSPTLKNFVHVSSVATLGRISGEEVLNEDSHWLPGKHNSNYAVSKYGGEREVWRGMAEGLPGLIVNPSVILGPGDRDGGSGKLFQRIASGFPFYSDGISGFVDVRDVSEAMRFLVAREIKGERFILNADNLSYQDLFTRIAAAMEVKAPYFHVRPWMGSIGWRAEWLRTKISRSKPFITRETSRSAVSRYRYSAAKIETLGFRFRPIAETVRDTAAFLKAHQPLMAL